MIGDLNSVGPDELAPLDAHGVTVVRHPERKDETDLELALAYAVRHGADEILVLGALGDRWDQTLANALLLASPVLARTRTWLVDGVQQVTLLHGPQSLSLNGAPGDTLSLLPLAGDAHGVTTDGLEYPLKDETLRFAATRGVSNALLNRCGDGPSRRRTAVGGPRRPDTGHAQGGRAMIRTHLSAARTLAVLAVLLSGLLAGCRAAQPTAQPLSGTFPAFPTVLTVMTHDSFSVSASVLAEFERVNNAKVQFVKAGDAGTMLNKAILSKDKPLADVLFGVDNTYLSRALKEGIFDAYDCPRPRQRP